MGGLAIAALVTVLLAISYHPDLDPATMDDRYASPASKFVEIDGMKVHYQDVGSGPTVLLIHGSNSSLHTWEGWVDRLNGKFRLITMDLPGHGLTGPSPTHAYDYRSYSKFIDHFAAALKLQKFSIAGSSMGGAIAMAYAVNNPGRVEKLVLIDTVGYADEVPPLILRSWGGPVLGHVSEYVTPKFVYASTLKNIYGHKERMTEARIDRYFDLLLRSGNRRATRERFSEQPQSWFISQLRSLTMPVLIMWGDEDPWFDVKFGERYARDLPNSRLVVYRGLGHLPMEEDPDATAPDVARFLKQPLEG
ncbi:alpha/beta fold hydrolase [Bradyrhizobium liaoningense]